MDVPVLPGQRRDRLALWVTVADRFLTASVAHTL